MKKRLALSFATLAGVGVLLGSATRQARSQDGSEPAFCAEMTPARLLEEPEIAHELYARRGDPAARTRFLEMVAEMRAVHGCAALDGTRGDVRAGDAANAAPRLPPGHPPIPRAPRMPVFSDESRTLSI